MHATYTTTDVAQYSINNLPANINHQSFKVLIIVALLFVLGSGFAYGKSTTFDGGASNTSWTDPGNWTNGLPTVGDDVTISAVAVIGTNDYVEVGSWSIGSSGDLTVNGTLVVDGNMTMDNNGSVFSMGASSIVVINGDAYLANKIDLSLSSYFIVTGNFTKLGSNDKGSLSINNAHIYLLGNVSVPTGGNNSTGPWDDFTSCNGSYSGTTSSLTNSSGCAYGNEQDYANNIDQIPSDVRSLIDCSITTSPTWIDVPSSSAMVAVGDKITLAANARSDQSWAYQPIYYHWTGPAGFVQTTGQTSLSISSATIGMSGYYKCTAVNSIGCSITDSTYVLV